MLRALHVIIFFQFCPPLVTAAQNGHLDIVKVIIDEFRFVDISDQNTRPVCFSNGKRKQFFDVSGSQSKTIQKYGYQTPFENWTESA